MEREKKTVFFSFDESVASIVTFNLFCSSPAYFSIGADEMASTLSAYNTRDSPFLDLDSPFTAW